MTLNSFKLVQYNVVVENVQRFTAYHSQPA